MILIKQGLGNHLNIRGHSNSHSHVWESMVTDPMWHILSQGKKQLAKLYWVNFWCEFQVKGKALRNKSSLAFSENLS